MSRLQRLRNKPTREHRIYHQAGPLYVIHHDPIDQADYGRSDWLDILTGLVVGIAFDVLILAEIYVLFVIVTKIGA